MAEFTSSVLMIMCLASGLIAGAATLGLYFKPGGDDPSVEAIGNLLLCWIWFAVCCGALLAAANSNPPPKS